LNDTIKQNMNNKIILWNINNTVISKSQPRKNMYYNHNTTTTAKGIRKILVKF